MSQFAWTFPGGKFHQEVTSITLVNNIEKVIDTVVPTGKIWLLTAIKVTNIDDVNRDTSAAIYLEVGKTNLLRSMFFSTALAANVGRHQWPSGPGITDQTNHALAPVRLAAGNCINVVWAAGGASAGGTDADGLVLEYLEIDSP